MNIYEVLNKVIVNKRYELCNRRLPADGFAKQNGRDAERAD